MELDFDAAAKKLAKDRDARKRRAEGQRAREEKVAAQVREAQRQVEERRAEFAAAQAAIRRREIEAQEQSSGVRLKKRLRAAPRVKADTNRVTLPKSVLEDLEAQRALDILGGPLTFKLYVESQDGSDTDAHATHCGVDEFTAEEGDVGIPPAVALSLAHAKGVDWLEGKMVNVELVQLPRFEKAQAAFQPRGQGFHLSGQAVVNLDIKSVLQRTLRDALTLTENDWIPIRHQGQTFELVVKSLAPASAMSLINTDVEVDLLPSEAVEQAERERKKKLQEEKAAREEREAKLADREARITAAKAALAGDELGPKEGAEMTVRIRLPNGRAETAAFKPETPLRNLLAWIQVCLPVPVPPDVRIGDGFDEFSVVWTRVLQGKRVSQVIDCGKDGASSIASLGFAPRESLLVEWAKVVVTEQEENAEERGELMELEEQEQEQTSHSQRKSVWAETEAVEKQVRDAEEQTSFTVARLQAEQKLDHDLEQRQLRAVLEASLREGSNADEQGQSVDKVHVFHTLVAGGIEPSAAANAAQMYSQQIVTLETMGFTGGYARSIELLKKYQGRLERVVNILAGAD